jgi:hypothetical protein
LNVPSVTNQEENFLGAHGASLAFIVVSFFYQDEERADSSIQTGAKCQKEDWPTHKANCRRQNYILKVDLLPRFITNPRITRTLSCPATAKFALLHTVLQIAFGWANTHLYDFEIFDHTDTRGREHRLSGPEPLFKITDLNTLDETFSFGVRDSSRVELYQILDDPKTEGKTIHYSYDFGDGWEHVITSIGRADSTTNFVCLDGEGHGCAEDVGGYSGWKQLLEAYDAQNPTRDMDELISWFETRASNKDSRGLRGEERRRWDKDRINAVLRELDTPASSSSSRSILLVSLEKQTFFEEMYSEVLGKLRSKATVTEVTHIASAMQHLSEKQDEYAAIIVSDPAIMEDDFIAVRQKLVEYVCAGGTVILGFNYSGFAQPDKLNRFFKDAWSLNWEFGAYQRSTYSINSRANERFTNGCYPNLRQYSMKAVHLKNTQLEERVYVSTDTYDDKTQSPVIFAKYAGSGYLGWIGDVNAEIGTTELLLAMCNL